MAESSLASGGPGVEVSSWTTHDKQTGTRSLHLEFTNHYAGNVEWVRGYADGRRPFRDSHVEKARMSLQSGQPAEAIIFARIASEIPSRFGPYFHDQGTVIRAMEGQFKEPEPLTDTDSSSTLWLRRARAAITEAFGSPFELKNELSIIIQSSRLKIKTQEVEHWSDAITSLAEAGDNLGAGLSASELAKFYEADGQTLQTVEAYAAARSLFKEHEQSITARGLSYKSAAELDSTSSYLEDSAWEIVKLCTGKKLEQPYLGFLANAATDLYYGGLHNRKLLNAFKTVSKNSGLIERRQYRMYKKDIEKSIRPPSLIYGAGVVEIYQKLNED